MRKSIFYCGVLCGVLTLLAGCGNKIPEMDETSRNQVVEYAAAVVREHDINRTSKLLEKKELEEALEEEAKRDAIFETGNVKEAEENETSEKSQDEAGEESPALESGTDVIDNTSENEEAVPITLEEILSLEEIGITYAGYEIVTTYPQDTENIYFTMNATEGNNLFVLKFDVTNLSQSEQSLDMIGKNIRYKIVVNGKAENALTTMLLNDLSSYQGVIEAGAQEQLVLVREISEEEASIINEVSLSIKNAEQTATISLN